jgi:predicted ATPase
VHDKKVINGVSEWLERSMDYKLSLKDIGSGLYNIVVKKHDGTQDNLIDVGYGISQVLPIVAQLVKMRVAPKYTRYYPYNNENRCSTLIIEQPELHLHPEAQAELANLFVDAVEKNTPVNELNLLIETHSEHLIRRLQALVANKNNSITNEDVKIYYVDKNTKNEAYITEMKMLSNGQFEKEWPTGFFDKGYKLALELFDQ